MTLPILEGLDGVEKMSKSLHNYIAINDPPEEMFGKLMSISDTLMWRYLTLVSLRPASAIEDLRRTVAEGANPRDIKFLLAEEIVGRFHSPAAAQQARTHFVAQFQQGAIPEDIPKYRLSSQEGKLPIATLLKEVQLVASTTEARRMIRQGAVRIDGEKVNDETLLIAAGTTHVFQIGKRRFAQVSVS
jgi:tyrosyl-tRNA synthetase